MGGERKGRKGGGAKEGKSGLWPVEQNMNREKEHRAVGRAEDSFDQGRISGLVDTSIGNTLQRGKEKV